MKQPRKPKVGLKEGTVLIYSGGLDSTTLLYWLLAENRQVLALGIDYGQRHRKELEAARRICRLCAVEFQVADLTALRPLLAFSALTSEAIPVPEGYYTDESMRSTVVPNRNMLMLSVAIAWAISRGLKRVAYAAHAGDHAVYPDCRPKFVKALSRAAALCHYEPVRILRPFVRRSKAEIVHLGSRLKVPFELTWSCYQGGEIHCGRCGTCTERAEAFYLAGLEDPTEYETRPNFQR